MHSAIVLSRAVAEQLQRHASHSRKECDSYRQTARRSHTGHVTGLQVQSIYWQTRRSRRRQDTRALILQTQIIVFVVLSRWHPIRSHAPPRWLARFEPHHSCSNGYNTAAFRITPRSPG